MRDKLPTSDSPAGAPIAYGYPPPASPVAPGQAPTQWMPTTPDPPDGSALVNGAPSRRTWVTWVVRSLVIALMLGLGALSSYLWIINDQWSSQNDQLRAEALSLGQTLAQERIAAQIQAEELDLVRTQLQNATARISDLANEEANAIDDRKVIESLATNLKFCSDQRQAIIDVLTDSNTTFRGKSAAQVERETTAVCDEIDDTYDSYFEDRDR